MAIEPEECGRCKSDNVMQRPDGDWVCNSCGFIVLHGDDSNVRGFQ